ncbi:MAG: hypothetical protein NUW23_16030 [Firmicutes bacterium]|jgi:hypothetical protein|nr:hypothetical protein [Bacillota bacterium]
MLRTLLRKKKKETRAGDFKRRLRDKFVDAIAAGAGVFRGVVRDGSSLGRSASEALKAFLEIVVGELYPKLEMGVRQLKGTEAGEVLKAANLGALPQVFYGGEGGLNLIIKEGGKLVLNPGAAVAAEVLNFLVNQQQYGIKVTGKTLEEHFQGLGYGWERDLIRLVLAVLLRAGAIEVTYEGRRYTSYSDPLCRIPLTNNNAFKAASFAPRKSIVPSTLTKAAEHYEEITGREVDTDEEAISHALKMLAEGELTKALWAEASAKVNDLPVASFLTEYRQTLETILGSAPDERVIVLANEGRSFKEARDRTREIVIALEQHIAESVQDARVALRQMWPEVQDRADNGDLLESARELEAAIEAEEFYKNRELIEERSSQIAAAYQSLYRDLHEKRAAAFAAAVDEVRGCQEWSSLAQTMRQSVLAPLVARSCSDLSLLPGATACCACRATMSQMEADLAALPGLKAEVAARIQELTAPVNSTKRVRLREHFPPALDSEESVDRWIEEFREYLHKLIAEGFTIVLE